MKKAANTPRARCKYGAACPYRTSCRYQHNKKEIEAFYDYDNNMDNLVWEKVTAAAAAADLQCENRDLCHRLGRCICNDMDYWCGTEDCREEDEEETGSTGSASEETGSTGSAGEEPGSTDSADNDVDYWALAADCGEGKEDKTGESATSDTSESVEVQTSDGMVHQLKAHEEFQVGLDVWAKTYTKHGEFYFINLNTWESRWDPLNLEPDRAYCGYNDDHPPPSVLE